MPKPIINTNGQQLDINFTGEKQLSMLESSLEERNSFKSLELAFREKRPQSYLELMKNAVPDIVLDDTFYGVLGKCYLGDGYDVHTLSKKMVFGMDEVTHELGFGRMILKHFLIGENLPDGLEKGRSLAVNPSYAFVEVYSDKLIAVHNSGNVSIIKD